MFDAIGGKSVAGADIGNGIVRNYLARLLASASERSVPVLMNRAGAAVPLSFSLK